MPQKDRIRHEYGPFNPNTLLITGVTLWIFRNLRGRKNDQDLTLKEDIIII